MLLVMNRITHTVLNSHSKFSSKQIELIERALARASKVAKTLLPALPPIDIVFYNNPVEVLEDVGVGGRTPTENLILVPLNSSFNFSEDEVFITMCHEMHHAMRIKHLGMMSTLMESVVAEGLAEQFEKELLPDRPLITYNDNLPDSQIKQSLKDLKQVLTEDSYDHDEWFSGSGKYPNWYGYTIGNYIVSTYGKKHNLKPSELVNTPTKEFESFLEFL
jgi:uncharacterized protein YjaZ